MQFCSSYNSDDAADFEEEEEKEKGGKTVKYTQFHAHKHSSI